MNRTLAFLLLVCACDPGKIEFPDDSDDGDDTDAPACVPTEETCNGLDDDCDGSVDEDLPADTWYTDADGDGIGDTSSRVTACDAPDGAVSVGGDCDDGDDSVTSCRYSGEAALTDDADAVLVGEEIMTMAGQSVRHAGDLNGDGFGDVVTTSNQSYGTSGGIYLVNGPIEGEMPLAEADGIVRPGAVGGELGLTLRSPTMDGDLDGDGYADLSVSDYTFTDDMMNQGRVWVMSGPLSGTSTLEDAAATISGSETGGVLGTDLMELDLDGDGQDDLIGGALGSVSSSSNAGAVVALFGPISGALTRDDADVELVGESGGDGAGSSLCTGDYNGDGSPDLVIGARGVDGGMAEAGAVYVVYGPVSASVVDLAYADAVVSGSTINSHFGEDVWSAGDSDGDGYEDLYAVAPFAATSSGTEGAGYLFAGPLAGSSDATAARATFTSASLTYPMLYTRWTHADLDQDGFDDTIYSAGTANAYDGAVFMNYGPVSGAVVFDDGGADAVWNGNDSTASFLNDVDAGGDVDGDGTADLLVGAPSSVGFAAISGAGRVHVLLGGAF